MGSDPSFNRINSGRSIPTSRVCGGGVPVMHAFQSYQFRQINPDIVISINYPDLLHLVSIVSIQADQSRQVWMQSSIICDIWFQSYQFRQINPDLINLLADVHTVNCFNRINSGRSIPTLLMIALLMLKNRFQSYQFRQINPDSYLWEASRGAVLRGWMAEPIFLTEKWLKFIQ